MFFVLTTRWLGWQSGIDATGGQDVHQYELMARAAPGLPDTPIGSAYTARFVVHWSVGALAALSGLPVEVAYRTACLTIMVAFALTARRCLVQLGVTGWTLRLGLCLALLNPYALRYYALVPGYLSDVVFQLGLALALLGALSRRGPVLVAGLLLAVVARQTTVVVAPVLALWVLGERRGQPGAGRRVVTAAAALVLPVAALLVVAQLTRPFTTPFSPRIPADTILPLVGRLPGSAAVLADHLLRVAAPLLLVSSMLLAVVLVQLRDRRRFPPEVYLLAVVGAAIIGQPLVIAPGFPGFAGNEPRLSALGFLPLVLGLAAALRSSRILLGRPTAIGLLLVVAVASLHHIYTRFGPTTSTQLLAVQAAAAGAALVLLLAAARRQPTTHGPVDPSGPPVGGPGDAPAPAPGHRRASRFRASG